MARSDKFNSRRNELLSVVLFDIQDQMSVINDGLLQL
jgi:hypothetical protein